MTKPIAQVPELPVRVSLLTRARVYYHVLEAEKHLAQCGKLRRSTRKKITDGIEFCRRIVTRGTTGGTDRRASVQLAHFEVYRREIRHTSGHAYAAMTAIIHAALIADCVAHDIPRGVTPKYLTAPVPAYVEVDFDNEVRAAIFHATERFKVPLRVFQIFSLYWRVKAYEQAYAYVQFAVENPLDSPTVSGVQETLGGCVRDG